MEEEGARGWNLRNINNNSVKESINFESLGGDNLKKKCQFKS